ncbi:unnamed protein product [Echinostoma caproni]|uniref:USP domain-containing protein n=1 Tax=Echinostoma caproni TaxID=27848 RepID=A0A183ATV9_9TREM|nr:unnamed protein product [Echinostoma caproni]
MLYCLVCILKGLRCTNRYITSNNLDGVLLEAHQMLLNELVESKRWSLDDQQDAPELFTYFMDVACSQSPGRTASKATEGLSLVSQLVGSRFEHAGPHCFHRGLVNGKSRTYAFRYPLRTDVFQRHLLANQVICTNCGYRSSPSLQAEACITLCLDKQVFRVPPEEVQSSVAYLLFYEREPPHFRSSVTGSLSHRVSNYEDGSLSGPSRPYGLVSDETNRPVPWAHSGMDGDVCAESIGTDNANVTIRFDDGDEDDTEDEDEEDCDEEGEDSDVPSDFAEEEFTGSRAEVIRSLAMAAKRLQM